MGRGALMAQDPTELIPELAEWGETPIEDWISGAGNYSLAIGYSRVFWPRIVRFGEYFLLEAEATEDAVEPWATQFNGDKSAVEGMLNHRHIADLHINGSTLNETQAIELGRALKEIYEAKLAWQFPNEKFEVFFDATPGRALVDYQVTFHKIREPT
jgi:hypothetical protein